MRTYSPHPPAAKIHLINKMIADHLSYCNKSQLKHSRLRITDVYINCDCQECKEMFKYQNLKLAEFSRMTKTELKRYAKLKFDLVISMRHSKHYFITEIIRELHRFNLRAAAV